VRLLAILRETGHWDDTLIIFLSDNGIPFPGAKTNLYDPGVRLPFVVRNPAGVTDGGVTDALAAYVDVTPTILDYAGVAFDVDDLHGRSFLGVTRGEPAADRNEVFLSHTFHEITMYYPMRAVRDGRYKLIWNIAHGLPFPFASDLYGSTTWQGVLERGDPRYGLRTIDALVHRPAFELYDLDADPGETRNLADDEAHAATLHAMQARLRAWQERTGDPWILKWDRE
jgi:N-sulfoglucosamine sulfohydrolase